MGCPKLPKFIPTIEWSDSVISLNPIKLQDQRLSKLPQPYSNGSVPICIVYKHRVQTNINHHTPTKNPLPLFPTPGLLFCNPDKENRKKGEKRNDPKFKGLQNYESCMHGLSQW